ncbi:MAG: hypothetical protein UR89_C0018G0001 [Candidatus Roizmanbacteria bacterium GW2011_GWA2_35_8]|uniref:DUF5678 domain-containing protein n=1 Tax=Candidatus Roizmanbacteria bacterium GW2011_GWA2_35_8 TaxID=1618479 RepID=A0A0G0DDC3_9BACT|nr:MAG: hypothetical protein UR89_C0018G0001 [Candidatus Roizmanbacteria bacterium GW2011_GWA2_35_8]
MVLTDKIHSIYYKLEYKDNMNNDLTNVYKKYKGLWVALDSKLNKVLAYGENAKDTFEKAKNKEAVPTLFKVPIENVPYVG